MSTTATRGTVRCVKCQHYKFRSRETGRCRELLNWYDDTYCNCECEFPAPQPAPDAEGDWRVDDQGSHRNRITIRDEKGRFSIYCLYGTFEGSEPVSIEEAQKQAAQIVSDHTLAASVPKLVEALKAAPDADYVRRLENVFLMA